MSIETPLLRAEVDKIVVGECLQTYATRRDRDVLQQPIERIRATTDCLKRLVLASVNKRHAHMHPYYFWRAYLRARGRDVARQQDVARHPPGAPSTCVGVLPHSVLDIFRRLSRDRTYNIPNVLDIFRRLGPTVIKVEAEPCDHRRRTV